MTRPPPLHRRVAFTDTGAYFALSVTRETQHAAARAISAQLIAERWRLYTTNFVLAETHALFLDRVNRHEAWRILRQIEQSDTTILRVTDATSFAVMERLGITHAFTFDRNFSQYGVTVLSTPRR